MRIWLLNTLLVVGSVVVPCLVIEGGARVLFPTARNGSCTMEDPAAIYRYRPNCTYSERLVENEAPVTYSFNACGYRTPFDCTGKRNGAFRIVTLGDSFTLGAMSEIDDHFMIPVLDRIEQEGRVAVPLDWQNLGTAGYDPLQYYARFEEALDLEPDLIVLGVTPNDLFGDLSRRRLLERRAMVEAQGGAQTLSRESRYDFVTHTKRIVSSSRALTVLSSYLLSSDRLYYRLYLARGSNSDFLSAPLPGPWAEKVDQLAELIEDMAARSRASGSELVVVLIPQRIQHVAATIGAESPGVAAYGLGEALRNRLAGSAIPFVDGLEALDVGGLNGEAYFPVDGHLTPLGNRLLGEFLGEKIVETGIIPAATAAADGSATAIAPAARQ